MEQLNLGNEGGKSSRRLSSILKVSRTSMREPGAEQEVQQEEITKPIEKKRNSRRVSFAATKNVRVFSKDAKGESPVLATAQNTTVGEHRQDEKILHFVDKGNQIKGLDTLLNTPLYVSQHLSKENFFSDPVLQDDCVDRTMLLGEDTGYMDMTHSHTIMIDKDYENDEMNPNFGLKVTQKITGGQIVVAGQKGLSCDTKVEPKNPAMDSDFNAFLASISLPTVKNTVQKKERGGLICSANTSTSEIDKENQLPPFLIKQVQPSIGRGNPQLLPQGLQRRRSRVAFSEDDDMETTKSHTVVIENKSNDQPVLSFVSENNTSIAFSREDDMELTQSQTAAINVRLTGNISSNVQTALDQNRSHYFSENDDAMDMTGTFDLSRRENEYTVSMKKEAPISKASKMSSFSVFGNGEMMGRNEPNFSMVQTANSDEMEMTEALDVPVQEQEHTARMKNESLFSSVSKKTSINVFGSGEIMDHNKSGHFSIAQTVNSDDMEMTRCQTIVLEAKQISGDQPLSNSRKSFPHAASINERALFQIHKPSKMSSNNGISNEAKMDRNNLSIAQTTNSDDMEMTQCQTIVLEAKQISGDQPLSNSRKSFPHAASIKERALLQIHKPSKMSSNNGISNETIMDRNNLSMAQTTNSDDMEMTEALEVSVQDSFSQISKKSYFNLTKNAEINKSYHLPIAQTADSDDMEMTRCQTIVLEAEQFSGDQPLSKSRKSFSDNIVRKEEFMNQNKSGNLSIAQDINSDDMEMTEALEVSVQDKEYTVSEKEKMSLQSSKISKRSFNLTGNVEVIDQTANIDDMEMTQCQTVILEAKQFSGDTLRRSLVTKSSDGMDMTQAFTGRIVLNPHSTSKKVKQQSILLPTSKHNLSDSMNKTGEPSTFAGIAPPSPDEMELTGCTTVNIDSNPTWLASAADTTSTRRANQTITVAVPMEMTQVQILPVSERKAFMPRRKSMTTGRGMMSFCNPENIEADNFSNSDEMEMTRCQTIVLEAENYERCKPLDTSRNTLNIASSRPDVDCMEMTQAFTGNIMLKSHITVEERKTEGNLFSTAQSCQMQDWSASGLHQASTSDLAVPCVDDGMEFTNCNTIAIDTLADTDTNIKEIESATSRSSGEQNEIAAKSINQDAHHSNHIPFNLQSDLDTNLSKMDENDKMARSSRIMTTESVGEDDDMQVTKVITMPFETQDSVRLNQTEVANKEKFSGIRTEEKLMEGIWPTKEQSENSVQLELSSTSDSFIKEDLQHRKSRRRSLAEFQTELQNMSRRINKEEFIKGATAPLPSCSLPEVSPKEQCETAMSVEPGLNVTPNVKRGSEKATPFSLKKKPFSSRISFCGIVPKLTKRSAAVTPNKTVTISTPSLPHFPLEKHLDVEQNSSCVSANINEEELPEMSSEEDFSGSIENWPIHKEDEQVDFLDALKNVEPLEDDVFELNVDTSQSLKRPYLEETSVTAERTKKACISDTGPDCHEGGVQWEGNFTSHVAQNPSAKMIEDTGVSESTLRYSQCDSHIDGTMDYEFDFNKKLEDGSITVNEFLSHFGINFVIHRSRPSALPDIRRAGETRTMEDLLKEKYIHHPKQIVYEHDCKELTDIVERLKERTPEQEKSLRCINEALFQEICSLSKEQLKNFGSELKARRVYFGKRSKALSHEMKGVLYSKLIKTTQDAKQQLTAKIKETDEMIDELDGCINDLERELAAVDAMISENHHNSNQTRPALKAKEDDLHKLNSALNETESEIDQLQIQQRTLEGQEEKLREECSGFKSHLATLNSLNEWRLEKTDERGALFTFLHNTVHLQVKLQTPAGNEWMTEGVEQNMDVSLSFQLNVDKSECHASMVHKLLALHEKSQTQWMQKYPTTRHIPELLHDVSLVVGRLRLLGEEIHRLKKWGGLRLCIRQITCVDTKVQIIFSSLKAFEKFELSLMVTPDYPFGPLQIQDFRNHIGNTRLGQIEDIVSSVKPDKNYLTNILKKIHSDLLT
ncbi:uncharacterized protein knl1 [Misgurnus anguillicaudatus]|uniref:uncharacterized protein knl1 n=1 Tax=Misgurnus anguillicaudatus TaxID=75329 RepID=UPI003CCFB84C